VVRIVGPVSRHTHIHTRTHTHTHTYTHARTHLAGADGGLALKLHHDIVADENAARRCPQPSAGLVQRRGLACVQRGLHCDVGKARPDARLGAMRSTRVLEAYTAHALFAGGDGLLVAAPQRAAAASALMIVCELVRLKGVSE
jgi:hypothetical protein